LEESAMSVRSHERGIIVGVDGSLPSRAALEWALDEASLRHCKLRLVYADVMNDSSESVLRRAQELLAREAAFSAVCAPDVLVESELHEAFPVPALIAEGSAAEMVVVGNRGRGGFASLALGSVGVQLAAHAPCPLVVVRHADDQLGPGQSAGRVVVGVDGSPLSELALDFAFLEASLHVCGLTAVHVAPLPLGLPSWGVSTAPLDAEADLESVKLLLAESLAGWQEKYPDVDVIQKARLGHAGYELIHEARGASLVVVGSRGRGGFRGLFLGSTSQALVHHAPCPVAVVRNG
jgi:nucleotide-binding universal stress UspA family protein